MDKFLDIYTLPRLNQKEIESLKRTVTSSEIEAVINSLPNQKTSRTRWIHSQILPEVQRGTGTIPSETDPNNRKKELLPNPFYEASIILYQNLAETQQQKKNFRTISLMNIKAKVFNKILANQI